MGSGYLRRAQARRLILAIPRSIITDMRPVAAADSFGRVVRCLIRGKRAGVDSKEWLPPALMLCACSAARKSGIDLLERIWPSASGSSLGKPPAAGSFRALCAEADGFISSTTDLVPLYEAADVTAAGSYRPYPIEERPGIFPFPSQREGIFIGTREFKFLQKPFSCRRSIRTLGRRSP
jgi:hypothetical protein